MIPEFSWMKFFEPEIFSKKFQIKFLITEKIQVPRLKTSKKVTSNFWNWSMNFEEWSNKHLVKNSIIDDFDGSKLL